MKQLKQFLWFLAAAGLLSIAAAAQTSYAPVVAKTRRLRYKIGLNGSKTLVDAWVGVYLRSSSGAMLLKQQKIVNNQPRAAFGTFTDASGNVYELHWSTKEAIQRQFGVPAPEMPFARATGDHRTINGVDCVVKPIVTMDCTGGSCEQSTPTGPNWVCGSPKYGTVVHEENTVTVHGEEFETVTDTYDFQEIEPDPAALTIPAGFMRRVEIPQLNAGSGH